MIFGSISAIFEKRINKMIAFSSAAQIGYIYLAIGMGEAGIACALFQILTHAVTKPLLFTAAHGLSEASSSKTQLKYLRNSGRRNVLAGIGFTVGALSMIGFPFFAGFVVKYVYIQSALEGSVETYKLVVVILSLVISTLLFSKILKENLPPCTLLSSILADTPLTSLLEEQLFNVLIANIELEIATIDPKSNEKIFTFLFISRFTNVINRLLLLL